MAWATIDWDEVLSRLPLDAIGDFINPSGPTWRDIMDHDTLDDFWRAIRFDDRYDTHGCPLPARDRLVRSGGPARRVPPLRRDDGELAGAGPAAADRRSLEPRQLTQFPTPPTRRSSCGPEAALEMDDVHLALVRLLAEGRSKPARSIPRRSDSSRQGTNLWREAAPLAAGDG